MKSVSDKLRMGLLELRADQSSLYAVPSFYERLYLLWIFRNFNSLAQPILSGRQQRFIDNLASRASTLEPDALSRPCVIGVIENFRGTARKKTLTVPATELIEMSVPNANSVLSPAVGSEIIAFPRKYTPRGERKVARKSVSRVAPIAPPERLQPVANDSFRSEDARRGPEKTAWPRWAKGAASMAALLVVLLYLAQMPTYSTWGRSGPNVVPRAQSSSTPQAQSPEASQPAKAVTVVEVKASTRNLLVDARTKVAPNTRSKAEPPSQAVELASPLTPPLQIPGAPDHGLTYPEAPDPNLTGVVNLRALIAPDGSVKDVTVLDGKRVLGAAAARAVRHWRYRPPEFHGQAVEAETRISFTFLGDDAVSVRFPSSPPQKQN
jgi:TonB family protein